MAQPKTRKLRVRKTVGLMASGRKTAGLIKPVKKINRSIIQKVRVNVGGRSKTGGLYGPGGGSSSSSSSNTALQPIVISDGSKLDELHRLLLQIENSGPRTFTSAMATTLGGEAVHLNLPLNPGPTNSGAGMASTPPATVFSSTPVTPPTQQFSFQDNRPTGRTQQPRMPSDAELNAARSAANNIQSPLTGLNGLNFPIHIDRSALNTPMDVEQQMMLRTSTRRTAEGEDMNPAANLYRRLNPLPPAQQQLTDGSENQQIVPSVGQEMINFGDNDL
jgi:hypothetical protein